MFRSVVLVLNAKFPKLIHFLLGDDGCRLCHRANTRSMGGFENVDTCSKKLLEMGIILRQEVGGGGGGGALKVVSERITASPRECRQVFSEDTAGHLFFSPP